MPYLKSGDDTDRLELPSDGAYWVAMKRRAEYGDQLAAQGQAMQIEVATNGHVGATPKWDSAAYVRALIVSLVVDWNLDDENGQKLPISPAIIERLDPRDGDFLAKEANERVGSRPDEKNGPFASISGLPSTGTTSRTRRSRAS